MTADKVTWGPGRKKALIEFLDEDLRRAEASMWSLRAKWRDYLTKYRPLHGSREKSFPYEGAAAFDYPFTMMSVNPILANELQTLHATPNLWTVLPLNGTWQNAAKPLQDWLTYLDRNILNMWSVNYRVGIEKHKLGTGIYKVSWDYRRNRVRGYDENMKAVTRTRTINRPAVSHVRLADFLIPPEANDHDPDMQDGAIWVAERFRVRPSALKALGQAQSPLWPAYDPAAVDAVLDSRRIIPTEDEQKRRELDRIDEGPNDQLPIELLEVHIRFDSTGDGVEDDLVVIYEPTARVLLRAMYNPYAHGKRPYHVVRYLRGDGFWGIGVGEQSEIWQDLISEFLNNSIDKARLSNAPMLAFKEGANVLPNEPIFPTKMWPLQDPSKDLVPLFLTDNRGNLDYLQMIGLFTEAGNQHVGVSDLRRGSIGSLPSRTPATTVQSMLQESNTLLDLAIKDIRKSGLSDVGLQVLELMHQMTGNPKVNPGAGRYVELAAMAIENGEFVSQILELPAAELATGIGVELTATSGTNNKVLEQQKLMGILQLGVGIATPVVQLMQIAETMQGSATSATALGAAQGLIELYKRLLEQHDIRNVSQIVPDEGLAQVLASAPNPGAATAAGEGAQ